VISLQTRPEFVLVWLLSMYVIIGLIETVYNMGRGRRTGEEAAHSRRSIPPAS
jgi:uncharacterized membrane protein